MSSDFDHKAMVDALRMTLGLAPLYRQRKVLPPFIEVEFGTLDTPAALMSKSTTIPSDGMYRDGSRAGNQVRGPRCLSGGRRVGQIFMPRKFLPGAGW